MNCEHCQNLLLDHLYGLLEGAEAVSVDAHLANCPACAGARAETARVQGLLARAAKNTFPNTTFAPPVQTPAPQKADTPSPAPALPFPAAATDHTQGGFSRRLAHLVPWTVAAAVLLAIPGTVVPVLNIFDRARAAGHDAEVAQREADAALLTSAAARYEREGRLGDARMRLAVAEQNRAELLDGWMDAQKAAVKSAAERKLTIDVLKPATVQPGAPNDFLLVVRDERKTSEARGKLVAEIRASDAVLFTQPIDHERGGHKHEIRLPASAWAKLKPDAELTLVVSQVDEKTQARTPLQEVRLAGPVFTTLLVTDKPTYRPGDRLFFRSLTLDRATLKPPQREQVLRYDLVTGTTPFGRLVSGLTVSGTSDLVRVSGDPGGRVEPVRTADGQPVRGVGCGEFVLPTDLADGEYTLVLREPPHPDGFTPTLPLPVTRTVKVRAGATDHYAKQIGFARASFVPGDTVEAWAELKFQDKPVQNAELVEVAVEADGVALSDVAVAPRTDARGRANVRFTLPDDVLNGDVRVKVTFRAGGRDEVVADRVPVIGRRLKVEFFPECGDGLVTGVPCKVYVRATTPAGQPVDISGTVTDGRQTLATVKTLHDDSERGANRGLASFTFTPQAGTLTWLKLDAPNTVYSPILVNAPVYASAVALVGGPGAVASRTGFELPEARLDGVVMTVPDTITAPGQPIRVQLHSVGQPRSMVVGAYVRGRLADTQKVHVEPGQPAEVKLMAGTDPRGGVVRITAFEEVEARAGDALTDLKPVAERLVFRRAGEALNLALAVSPADASQRALKAPFAPGTNLNCAVSATDERNNPVAAVLWAAVVNTGVAPGAKDRTMPTHFLLAGEVQNPDNLEYADFLLTDHPKAGEALDLVLGTQGWRRFAEQTPVPLAAGRQPLVALAGSPERHRLMVQNGQNPVWAEPTATREYRKITDTYAPLYENAVQSVARAKAALDATPAPVPDVNAIQRAEAAANAAKRTAEEQQARAAAAQEPVHRFRSAVWYGVAGFAGLALLCGGVSLARPQTRLPLGASTIGSFGLAAFLFVAAGWGDEAGATESARTNDLATAERATEAALVPARPLATNAEPPDAGAPAKAAPKLAADFKFEAPGRPDRAFGGGSGFGGGGFGGGFTTPNAAGRTAPGALPKEPPFPPGIASPPYPSGGPPEVKGGTPPNGVPRPSGPVPVVEKFPPALPAGPGGVGGGAALSKHLAGVTAADLARNGPSDSSSYGTSLRAADTDRATALKQTADYASQFAHERQRTLTDSLNAQFGNRGAAKKAGPGPVNRTGADAAMAPVELEALALQQIQGSVNPLPPLVLREFAAPRPAPAPLTDAADPQDTILWQPVIALPADGKALVTFALGSAPGGYRVVVAGHTADGRLGEARTVIAVAPARTNAPPVEVAPGGSVPTGVPAAPGPPRRP